MTIIKEQSTDGTIKILIPSLGIETWAKDDMDMISAIGESILLLSKQTSNFIEL